MAGKFHRKAVTQAKVLNKQRHDIGLQIGSLDKPNTEIFRAYSSLRKSLRGNLDDKAFVRDTLNQFFSRVEREVRRILDEALEVGTANAQFYTTLYSDLVQPFGLEPIVDIEANVESVLLRIEAQVASVWALVSGGEVDENLILGDRTRVGLLTPIVTTKPLDNQANDVIGLALGLYLAQYFTVPQNQKEDYVFQAVAAIDQKTTDCCLRVHGHTRELDGYFILTGTPRYAGEMKRPPFHDWCRTSVALVRREDANDLLTNQMLSASSREIATRKDTTISRSERLRTSGIN